MGAERGLTGAAVVLLLAGLLVGPAVGAAGATAATAPCEANGGQKLCLADASLGSDSLSDGQSTTLSVTVENVGDERATAVVVLNVASPDDETDSYELRRHSLAPGEEFSFTQSVDATTPGTHAMQVLVYDDGLAHRYDASSAMTVTVESQSLGGAVDTPEYALAALAGSLAVLGGVVYRRR